jgi:hypothetical protein
MLWLIVLMSPSCQSIPPQGLNVMAIPFTQLGFEFFKVFEKLEAVLLELCPQ